MQKELKKYIFAIIAILLIISIFIIGVNLNSNEQNLQMDQINPPSKIEVVPKGIDNNF